MPTEKKKPGGGDRQTRKQNTNNNEKQIIYADNQIPLTDELPMALELESLSAFVNEGEVLTKNVPLFNVSNVEETSKKLYEKRKPNAAQVNGSVGQILNKGPPDISGGKKGLVEDTSILRSDLISAVEHNRIDKVRRILDAGIDANAVCDDKGRWPLHIAAACGFHAIAKLLLDHGAQRDQPDTSLERTPLLFAAACSPETVQVLLGSRADIKARNKFGANALHYAAGAGQGACCKILASGGCDVNSRDRQKLTPLHMACRVNDVWCIDVLLEYGANINSKDGQGKTVLMHAAETCEGIETDSMKMGNTFKRLVAAGAPINAIDNDGKSALYYAIQTGSHDAVVILHELGAELLDGVSLLAMGKKFPDLVRPFLDKCVSSNIGGTDPESKHFYIQFDYTCLTYYPKDVSDDKLLWMQNRDETEGVLREMGVLHGLTRCKDTSILGHPICDSLLRLKWKKVKWYLYLDMLLFAVFLAFLTAVIFMEYESDSRESELADNTTDLPVVPINSEHHNIRSSYCMDGTRNIVVWVILWFLTACLGIREMIQLVQAPLHYVVQLENILELVLVFSVGMLSLAECGVQSFVDARDHFAAVCLIVGWTIQVTLYGKIPAFGVYIRMFAAVAQNILKCLFTYLGLLFAFSLTLHFLFRTHKEFDSVGFTFLKTFAMMIGEIGLVRTFIEKDKNAAIVPFTSHLMFALFIIFISVILMSLLVALAVCDISKMQQEGEHMQLVQQVKVASQLEEALQHRSLLYPQFGMKDARSLHQRKGVIFPNLKDHGKLSKDALEIVLVQHTKKDARNSAMLTHNHPQPSQDNSNFIRQNTEIAEDLLRKLKDKFDNFTSEPKNKGDGDNSGDGGSLLLLSREILLVKNELEDMNRTIRDLSLAVKSMAERSDESSSTQFGSEKKLRYRNSIDVTTGTDFNHTSPELEVTEASSPSSPEPESHNRHRGGKHH